MKFNETDQQDQRGTLAFSPAGRGLLYFSAFVLTVAGLRAASSLVVPLLLSIFLSILCAPLLDGLQRRMPFPLALGLIVAMLVALFLAIPLIIGGSFRKVLGELPEFQQQLHDLKVTLVNQLQRWEINVDADNLYQTLDPGPATALLAGLLNDLLRACGDGVVVLIMTGFMLTEASWFSAKVALLDRNSGEAARRITQVVSNARRYVGIKTAVSLATGVLVWLGLRLLGVNYAPMWGFLAFVLNYVPTIGSIIAGSPPIILAFVQNGFVVALGAAALFVVINQAFGSIIEPRWQGYGLGLSPLMVFLSLLFWGWVLGPVGMLLSAPLTMVLRIACEEFAETRWIAIMLGGKPSGSKRANPSAMQSEPDGQTESQ